MSLELVNTKQLFTCEALDIGATTTIANSGSYWWTSANIVESDTDTPADAWFEIDVSEGDALYIVYRGAIQSLAAGDRLCDSSGLRVQTAAFLKGEDEGGGLLSNAWLGTTVDTPPGHGFIEGRTLGVAPFASGGSTVPFLGGNGGGADVSGYGLLPDTGAAITAPYQTEWILKIGEYFPARQGTSNVGVSGDLIVSPYSKVYVAMRSVPTLSSGTANYDIDDYDAEIMALVYRDVQKVDKVDRRAPTSAAWNRVGSTPGAGA